MTEIDIIVSGHLCLDLIPGMAHVTHEEMLHAGRLIETDPLTISTGGVVSNSGLALHRLGINVRLMSSVGGDLLGRVIIAYLKDRDPILAELITPQPNQPSSYSVVLSPQNSDRTFLHCTATNDLFGVANVDFAMVKQAKIFHLGYPPLLPRLMLEDGRELAEIYQRAKQTGVVTSLDMTLPDANGISGKANWQAILKNTLPYVDIFLPSIEEILFMLRRRDFDQWKPQILPHLNRSYLAELADELLSLGVVVTGFKLGAYGFYLKTAPEGFERLASLNLLGWAGVELWQPAFEVAVAGTTGAGDAAYGGFLAAMIHGMSPAEALQWACAVGACCIEAPDATSGVRTWEETAQRLAAGWPVVVERLAGFETD